MLYFTQITNYEKFKELFAMITHGNGQVSRRNKILLNYLNNKKTFKYAIEHNLPELLTISSMIDLKNKLRPYFQTINDKSEGEVYPVMIMGEEWHSRKYKTDEYNGICEDQTYRFRYINVERNHEFCMRMGRMINELIAESCLGDVIDESVPRWLGEEYAEEWKAWAEEHMPDSKYKLHVNENFKAIYDSDRCLGDFHSCMTDENQHYFYENAVEAKAAYLTDDNDYIVARAIIFTEVMDEEGKIWRLCERQYCTNEDESLKRMLVRALIREGEIDGYKKVGVDCHSNRAFVDNEGNSLEHKRFTIDCNLGMDDTLSYQDTFVYYDMDQHLANNYASCEYKLNTTESSLAGEYCNEYDEYHEEYCHSTIEVYYQGRSMECNINDLEDFIEFHGNYYHEDDFVECDECESRALDPTYYEDWEYAAIKSELTGKYYCDTECLEEGEDSWKEEHWFWSEYNEEYYQNEDEVTEYNRWVNSLNEYVVTSISVESLNNAVINGEIIEFEDEYYDEWETDDEMNSVPFGMSNTKVMEEV